MVENSTFKDRLRDIMALTQTQLENKAYQSLIQDELRQTEIALIKILNKHGVQDSKMLEQWFKDGIIPEADAWEDFFELDGLEHKRKQLKLLLQEL